LTKNFTKTKNLLLLRGDYCAPRRDIIYFPGEQEVKKAKKPRESLVARESPFSLE